jgi:hypothetical protein
MDNPALVVPNGFALYCSTCGRVKPCVCTATLAAQSPPALPPSRLVKFGDNMICTVCNLDARYCKGHAPPDPPANDGAESDLIRRVRECTGGR